MLRNGKMFQSPKFLQIIKITLWGAIFYLTADGFHFYVIYEKRYPLFSIDQQNLLTQWLREYIPRMS